MIPITNKSFLSIFIVACIVMLLHAWYYYPFVADDSFISFRYIDRFLEGKGLTWNDDKRVEGYSNLLWVLLLAFIQKITHAELWIIAMLVGMACSIVTLYVQMNFVRRMTNGSFAVIAWSSAFFVVAAPVAIWINGGLEAPLVMVLLIAAVYLLVKGEMSYRSIIFAGILLGLLALTRPDGILFTWALSIGFIIRQYFLSQITPAATNNIALKMRNAIFSRVKPLVLLNLLVIAFFVGQLIFRLNYYGEWVPNTALVKLGFTFKRLISGSAYVFRMLLVYLPFLVALVFMWRKLNVKYKSDFAFLLSIIIIESAYLAAIGGDIFPGFRHVLPLIPLLCILSGLVITLFIDRTGWLRQPLKWATFFIVVMAAIFYLQFISPHNVKAKEERWEWTQRAIAETLRNGFLSQQPLIATTAAGTTPFFTKFPTLDMLGLNDYYLPRHPPSDFGSGFLAHELGDATYYMKLQPDIILFYGSGERLPYFRAEKDLFERRDFQEDYQQVKMKYKMDYSFPFPYYDEGLNSSVNYNDSCYLYVRTLSGRIGVRSDKNGILLLPAFSMKNMALPDSSVTIYLNSKNEFVTKIAPHERYFVPEKMRKIISEKVSISATIKSITSSGDSLVITNSNPMILYNPHSKDIELKELRISPL